MLPIFVFIALPTLSVALLVAILCRKFCTSVLYSRVNCNARRRAMSRFEGLQLLGLKNDADQRTIRAAYKRLMVLYHPDHGGSHITAARLNLARDTLLRKRKSRVA